MGENSLSNRVECKTDFCSCKGTSHKLPGKHMKISRVTSEVKTVHCLDKIRLSQFTVVFLQCLWVTSWRMLVSPFASSVFLAPMVHCTLSLSPLGTYYAVNKAANL